MPVCVIDTAGFGEKDWHRAAWLIKTNALLLRTCIYSSTLTCVNIHLSAFIGTHCTHSSTLMHCVLQETQAIHMHSGQGSYLEFTIPFVVDASGYTTKVNGQLMHLDATTSLKFRSLVQCETLEVCWTSSHLLLSIYLLTTYSSASYFVWQIVL